MISAIPGISSPRSLSAKAPPLILISWSCSGTSVMAANLLPVASWTPKHAQDHMAQSVVLASARMGIVDFDFVPLRGTADPYPIYDRMRETGRVLRSPFGALVVHRYDDVKTTHGDHDTFSMAALAA